MSGNLVVVAAVVAMIWLCLLLVTNFAEEYHRAHPHRRPRRSWLLSHLQRRDVRHRNAERVVLDVRDGPPASLQPGEWAVPTVGNVDGRAEMRFLHLVDDDDGHRWLKDSPPNTDRRPLA